MACDYEIGIIESETTNFFALLWENLNLAMTTDSLVCFTFGVKVCNGAYKYSCDKEVLKIWNFKESQKIKKKF